ncbi:MULTISPECIES: hypothetical protein [Empedobacter]|uniref:DUF3592 domain-containing protein n=1 Tax=Empedobacter falsenii TaxID=343874 RepID=A0A376GKL4_9FLAO|nr:MULTISPECIES: hypothetical protein [Empedobacter]MDH0658407.1 hypothetical protein [Empedobacter sp. GD03865]MDH0673714.1 hypothetical protein [Empedobacter sp. GD03861]MDM1041150.1 hypothetical protein [Empedobacter brevis]MDM1134786.1 hypothetical protein [Empedobacter sp. R750]RRT94482.1 hypothetical protein EGI89_00220 [Empedobacter falsenii]
MKLQNDYYFIRQIYALFGCIIALSICLYFYNRNIRIATQNKVVTTTIVEKSCSGSKGSSSVYVSYKQLIYKVKYGRNACAELNLGEKIKLYYDNERNILIKKEEAKHNLFQLTVSSIAILFFLLPWKKILS